jgi:hypothetical protein
MSKIPKPSSFVAGLGKYLNGLGKGLRFEDWDYEDKETRDKKTRRLGDKGTRRQGDRG